MSTLSTNNTMCICYLLIINSYQTQKHLGYGEGFQKKRNWHNEVHTYWHQFWCHIWWSPKTLKMCIESMFDQFWHLTSFGNWNICADYSLLPTLVQLVLVLNLQLLKIALWHYTHAQNGDYPRFVWKCWLLGKYNHNFCSLCTLNFHT